MVLPEVNYTRRSREIQTVDENPKEKKSSYTSVTNIVNNIIYRFLKRFLSNIYESVYLNFVHSAQRVRLILMYVKVIYGITTLMCLRVF